MSEAERDALREQLAALAHTQWSGWLRYQFTRGTPADAGDMILPAEWVERWQRQIETAYADLPEHDKESDRAEADRVLALLPQGERDALCAALVQEYTDILAQRGSWRWPGSHTTEPEALRLPYLRGAQMALLAVAARLGVTDLHERAAEVVARGARGGTLTMDSTLFDAVDSAAQQLAVVVNSLENAGDATLYRSALEAHTHTAMLRAELRARLRAAQEAEQARARAEPEP